MEKIDIFCGISSLGIPFPKENKNHIGYLTRDCAKIQICKLFHRKYRAGAPESFSNKGDVY